MGLAAQEFLSLLADDILTRPDVIKPLSPEIAARIAALTTDIPVCLSNKIEGLVAL